MRIIWRTIRFLGLSALLAVSFVVFLTTIMNVLINVGLPFLINQRPERLKISWSVAWMVFPGDVHVRGLRIRQQSKVDQWEITATRAAGQVDLGALRSREFKVTGLVGDGLTFHYRVRADNPAPPSPEDTDEPIPLDPSVQPPIRGLENPPKIRPEDIYPPPDRPWLVSLDQAVLRANEVWISDYRFAGQALVKGDFIIQGPFLDADLDVQVADTRVLRGRDVMAEDLGGNALILIDGMDREGDRGDDTFRSVQAHAQLSADANDLQFVEFYLYSAPWVSLDGSGHVALDVAFDRGAFLPGSRLVADFPDLVAGFMSYDVMGTGQVRAGIGLREGVPESQIDVVFRDFAITGEGSEGVLVTGEGFTLRAHSPDTTLNRPFTRVDAVFDLPESQIVDIAPYNEFLPRDIGFSILGGKGTMHGRLFATSENNSAHGNLWIQGQQVRAKYDNFVIAGALALHARLAHGRLDKGYYDMSGSSVRLDRVRFVSDAAPEDAIKGWSASMDLPSGVAKVGSAVHFDGDVRVRASNSNPFIAIFTEKGKLPKWAGPLLEVPDVRGNFRLRLGADSVHVGPARVTGGSYELLMQMLKKKTMVGDLYARYGSLSLGLGVHGGPVHVQVVGARAWYDQQPPLQ